MKTFTVTPETINHDWYIVDATGKTLGRLATELARRLRGKHKPEYTPHADTGDYLIVINAAQVHVTGKKMDNKLYYRHSGYPGGLKVTNFAKLMQKDPCEIINHAVRGMLPRNPLGRAMLRKLKVYSGAEHLHNAQQPKLLNI